MSSDVKALLVLTGLIFGVVGVAGLSAYFASTSGWPVLIVFPTGMAALVWGTVFGLKWATR